MSGRQICPAVANEITGASAIREGHDVSIKECREDVPPRKARRTQVFAAHSATVTGMTLNRSPELIRRTALAARDMVATPPAMGNTTWINYDQQEPCKGQNPGKPVEWLHGVSEGD
jgi:hypothetical protein